MDAIICNAGNAIRLGKLGETTKKCLFRDPNTDKSILWHQLDALNYINVENVFIVIKKDDKVIPVEVNRLKYRFPKMNLKCVSGNSETMLDSINTGLNYITDEYCLKLDGDVCILDVEALKPLVENYGNNIGIYKINEDQKKNGTLIYKDGFIDYFEKRTENNLEYAWACIEMWNTEFLRRIIKNSKIEEKNMLMHNINKEIKNNNINIIKIPTVYEVDDFQDYKNLLRQWDFDTLNIEKKCLNIWKSFGEYPKFSIDREYKKEIDLNIIKKYCSINENILDVGCGDGMFSKVLMKELMPSFYTMVEPNKFYCKCVKKNIKFKNKEIINTDFYTFVETCNKQYDTSIFMFSLLYLINESSLVKYLSKLNSNKLIIKNSTPDIKKYSKLLVNEYSKDLKTHYISIYRSIDTMCKILRKSGWCIKNIDENIYGGRDGKFGNSTYIIYVERN